MGEEGRVVFLLLEVEVVPTSHWTINYSPIRIPSLQQSQGVIKTRRISRVRKATESLSMISIVSFLSVNATIVTVKQYSLVQLEF